MNTPLRNVTRFRATTRNLRAATLASARTLAQEGAARRRRRRELARFNARLAGLGNGNDTMSKELREMLIADFESAA